ncbi:hypothetical protein Tco_1045856 [Tanacetum coccineum]|uniref:Uncharacterized protein n=1 Tax=Tanacetum coccineum TaxID=301880 RepID=A0ABQ5GU05_9ASTR
MTKLSQLSTDQLSTIESSSEELQNEKTPSPPPRKKSLSPPHAPSKSTSIRSTHYTSSSSPSESSTPTHVAPSPKLRLVIPMKQEPQELPQQTLSPNDLYVSTVNNWPLGPSNLSPPPRASQPPPGFEQHLPPQPLFVNINNNAPQLENTQNLPPNLRNQDFPNPPNNFLDFVHPNDMPYLHNMFCQCCSTTRHEIQMLRNRVNYMFSYIRYHLGSTSNPPYFPH